MKTKTVLLIISTLLLSPFSFSSRALGIVGGAEVIGTEEFAASTVGMIVMHEGKLVNGCSAVLISEEFALTAAHCLESEADTQMFIAFALNRDSISQENIRPVTDFRTSPKWRGYQSLRNKEAGDIALLHFSGGIPVGYRAARIPMDLKSIRNGMYALLVGYGVTDEKTRIGLGVLRWTETPVLNKRFSETEVLLDQTNGKGSCYGDSGGPVFANLNGKLRLWGIISSGIDLNAPSSEHDVGCLKQAVVTSIPAYRAWIKKMMQELSRHGQSREQANEEN